MERWELVLLSPVNLHGSPVRREKDLSFTYYYFQSSTVADNIICYFKIAYTLHVDYIGTIWQKKGRAIWDGMIACIRHHQFFCFLNDSCFKYFIFLLWLVYIFFSYYLRLAFLDGSQWIPDLEVCLYIWTLPSAFLQRCIRKSLTL